MAIDYMIGALIVASMVVNALALGAFWVSPGLRTTANRFVINLLIANLVGCTVVLGPSVFYLYDGGDFTTVTTSNTNATTVKTSSLAATQITTTTTIASVTAAVGDDIFDSYDSGLWNDCANETTRHANANCNNTVMFKDGQEVVIRRATYGDIDDGIQPTITADDSRFWGYDLTAALGALSVLLIVGDTWCAVTDPLRYHARVSKVKAWILITAAWTLSILFGIASAFQSFPDGKTFMPNLSRQTTFYHRPSTVADILPAYNTIFSCSYFVIIILLPICFVCGMYWKIFSEAKQNGVRMRQNGSSPLLQSALNLAASAAAAAAANSTTPSPTNPAAGGLIMKIDHHMTTTTTAPPSQPLPPTITTTSAHTQYLDVPMQPHVVHKPTSTHKDKNHNTLFSFASGGSSGANKEQRRIARNCSARHLLDCDSRSQLRSVRSTPNLQKNSQQHDQSVLHVLTLPAGPPAHVPTKALGYMTSIRHRLSNASSIFKYREESRAARISILVVIMCLVSYFPYGVLVLMHGRIVPGSQCQMLAAGCVIIANLSSPIIFAYRNKRVRRGILQLFGLDAQTNERMQKRNMSLRRNMSASTLQRQQSQATLQKRASTLSINSNRLFSPNKRKSESDDDELAFCCRHRRITIWKRICDACRKLGCMPPLNLTEPVDV